jgi:hypothetical protein
LGIDQRTQARLAHTHVLAAVAHEHALGHGTAVAGGPGQPVLDNSAGNLLARVLDFVTCSVVRVLLAGAQFVVEHHGRLAGLEGFGVARVIDLALADGVVEVSDCEIELDRQIFLVPVGVRPRHSERAPLVMVLDAVPLLVEPRTRHRLRLERLPRLVEHGVGEVGRANEVVHRREGRRPLAELVQGGQVLQRRRIVGVMVGTAVAPVAQVVRAIVVHVDELTRGGLLAAVVAHQHLALGALCANPRVVSVQHDLAGDLARPTALALHLRRATPVAILTHDLVSHRPRACAVAQEAVLHLRVLPTQHFSRARADFKKERLLFFVKVIGSPFSLAEMNPFSKVAEELFIRRTCHILRLNYLSAKCPKNESFFARKVAPHTTLLEISY